MKKIFLFLILFLNSCVLASNLIIPEKPIVKEAVKQEVLNEINWKPYFEKLETKIKSNWEANRFSSTIKIITRLEIDKNGKLLNSKIIQSSNDELADKKALEAIEKSAPFEKLPKEFKGKSVPIEFTFDYNILNQSTNGKQLMYFPYSNNLKKYPNYVINVEKKIRENLNKINTENYTISVELKIGKQGELISCKIISSSASNKTIKEVLSVIEKSAPFEKLPIDFNGEYMKFPLVFQRGYSYPMMNDRMSSPWLH